MRLRLDSILSLVLFWAETRPAPQPGVYFQLFLNTPRTEQTLAQSEHITHPYNMHHHIHSAHTHTHTCAHGETHTNISDLCLSHWPRAAALFCPTVKAISADICFCIHIPKLTSCSPQTENAIAMCVCVAVSQAPFAFAAACDV